MSRLSFQDLQGGLRVAFLLSRVQIKKRRDNRQQNNFPEHEDGSVEAAELVARILIHDECAKRDAHDQPDNLSLRVPHNSKSVLGALNFVL